MGSNDDMQIAPEQLALISYYAQMSSADKRRAWVTPRPSPSIGTRLHRWVELMAQAEHAYARPAPWRYRTGKRKR